MRLTCHSVPSQAEGAGTNMASGSTQTNGGAGAAASRPGYPRVVVAGQPKPTRRRHQMTIAGKKRDIPAVRHNLTSKYPFVDKRGTVEQALEGDSTGALVVWLRARTRRRDSSAVVRRCRARAAACSVGVQTSRDDAEDRHNPRLCYHCAWCSCAQHGGVGSNRDVFAHCTRAWDIAGGWERCCGGR